MGYKQEWSAYVVSYGPTMPDTNIGIKVRVKLSSGPESDKRYVSITLDHDFIDRLHELSKDKRAH